MIWAFLAALAGGCASFDGRGQQGSDGPQLVGEPREPGLTAYALWAPVVSVRADVDEDEPGGDLGFEADLLDAPGVGAGVEIGNGQTGARVTFVASEHEDGLGRGDARVYQLTGEAFLGARLGEGPVVVSPQFGIGVGGVALDFSGGSFDDTGGASVSFAGSIAIEFGRSVTLRASGSFAGFGYPGEWVGDVATVFVGLGATF